MKRLVYILVFSITACQIPYHAADVFEEKAELPKDEAPHTKNSLEWWYFTGHLEDSLKEKKLGVEYVVFHFNPTNVRGGWLLNMAVSDPENDTFYYDHKFFTKPKHQFEKLPLDMHWDKKGIQSRLQGQSGNYQIYAKMDAHPVEYELTSKPGNGVVLHDGVGYEEYGEYAKAGYYSFPRMPTEGKVKIKETTYQVQGNLWYDRQWNCSGVWERKVAWDWFAIQFEESKSELMMYRLYHLQDSVELFGGTYTDKNGKRTDLASEQIKIKEVEYWRSPDSDAKYPTKWEVEIPEIELKTDITVAFPQQELELKFSPLAKFYYWEGMSYANGKLKGEQVNGKAYVEMTNRFRQKKE
ncbi:MAG: lipocalin family protein [Vicingaceae bacterium]